MIIYYQGEKNAPWRAYSGTILPKSLSQQVWYNTSWHYGHKGNSSAPEKGKALMWQKWTNWNLSSFLGRDLYTVNVWDGGFFLNEKTQQLLRIADPKQGDIWTVGNLNAASWRCSRTSHSFVSSQLLHICCKEAHTLRKTEKRGRWVSNWLYHDIQEFHIDYRKYSAKIKSPI